MLTHRTALGCPSQGSPGPMQARRAPICASQSTVSSSSLLQLKLLKQQKHGVRHGPPAEPSTAVLLEERRCSGEHASSSAAAAAPAAAAGHAGTAAAATALEERTSIGNGAGSAVAEELEWLRRELSRRVEEADGQQQQHDTDGAVPTAAAATATAVQDQQQQQQASSSEEPQWRGRRQQQQQWGPSRSRPRRSGEQRLQRRSRSKAQQGTFAEWSAYCQLHASSPSLAHWMAAAEGLRNLVVTVRGPQQAQQAWELVCLLASRPLPQQAAKLVAHQAVELVTLSLDKGDYSILHALLAHRHPFAFGRRAVESLLRAACAADVELGELQAILRAVPQSQLTNRAFFVLVKSFEERGQVTEALHCQHQMQVLGLRPSPALEAALKRLREGRAAGSRASMAQR